MTRTSLVHAIRTAALAGAVLLCLSAGRADAQPYDFDLTVQKSGGGTLAVGQTATFSITATNAGVAPLPAGLITVTDQIQPPLSAPVTASGSGWNCTVAGTLVSCRYMSPTLPGASPPPITVTAAAGAPGRFTNCARVVLGAVPDRNPGNNEDCTDGVIQPPVDRFDLGIDKTIRGLSVVGQATVFTLSPSNLGPSAVGGGNGVTVTDVLPANFTGPISGSGPGWTCVVNGQLVTCTYSGPSVAPGAPLPPITVSAMTKAPGAWRNCARIALRGQDANRANNEDCIPGASSGGEGRRFDIGVRKSGPARVDSGQMATFTISPFNAGPEPVNGASGIRVTDLLPANFVGPVTASGSGWTCTVSGSGPYLVTCDYFGGAIPANGLFPTITITAKAREVGGWNNCADISMKPRDVRKENDQSCIGGEVRPGKPDGLYDVSIRKRGPDDYKAGQPATFTLTTHNNGPATVDGSSGVYVTDTLASGLTAPVTISAPPGWACSVSGLTVTCHYTGGPVPAGQDMGQIRITATVAKSGEIRNCAKIDFKRLQDIHPDDNRDCATGPIGDTGGDRYDVSVRKRGPDSVAAGQPATFVITPHNNGPSDVTNLSGLTVTDTLMAGLGLPLSVSVSPQEWSCVITGLTVTCTYVGPSVGAGQDFPQISITATARMGGEYNNCARIDLKAGKDTRPQDNRDCAGGVIGKPGGYDIGIDKTGPDQIKVGQPATFTLNSFNTGPSMVTSGMGVTVTDTLPANFAPPLVILAPPGWTCTTSGLSLICQYTGPPVPPGAPFPPITVSAVAIKAGKVENCAAIRLRPIDIKPSDNQDCASVGIIDKDPGKPDLAIEKTALEGPWTWPNGHGLYQITISNVGSVTLPAGHALTLVETIPAGMTLAAVPAGWTCTPGAGAQGPVQVNCSHTLATALAPGASISLFIQVRFHGERRKTYENCVELRAWRGKTPWGETNFENNRDCTPVEVVGDSRYDLSIRKRGPGSLTTGQSATFTLTPHNNGLATVDNTSGVTVVDTLSGGLVPPVTFNTSPDWSCSAAGLKVTCVYIGPPITAGHDFPPITITAVAGKPGKFRNCADINLTTGKDINAGDNQDCVGGLIDKPAGYDVDLTKTGPASVTLGYDASFTLTASNNGPLPVDGSTGLTVTDTLPPNFSWPMAATGNGWACGIQVPTVSCTYTGAGVFTAGQDLPPITITARTAQAGQVDNCATLTLQPTDLNPKNNGSCINIVIEPHVRVCIQKYEDLNGDGDRQASEPGLGGWVFEVYAANDPNQTIIATMTTGTAEAYFGQVCTVLKAGVYIIREVPQPGWINTQPGGNPAQQQVTAVVGEYPRVWFGNQRVAAPTPPSLVISKSILDDCWQGQSGNDVRCTFRVTITSDGAASWTGPLQFTDLVQPQPFASTVLVGGQPAGWVCTGAKPMTCDSNGSVTIPAGGSVTVDFTVDIPSPVGVTQNCVSLTAPTQVGPSCVALGGGQAVPSLTIEKVVEEDCTGAPPHEVCKFVIRIFNTGTTQFTGNLTFTDLLTSFGDPTMGVSLVAPLPSGWACGGSQPTSCISNAVSIAAGGHVTVVLYMKIDGPIPPDQNCAVLTSPVPAGPACAAIGNTHYDLGLDNAFEPDPAAPGYYELSHWIANTPQVALGTQVTVTGSLTPAAFFSPSGPIPASAVISPGWSCSGTWASFLCSQTATAASFTNGYLVLRLRTSYPASAGGQTFTYVGAVTKANNIDPDPSDNSLTVTGTLP